jgi:predicted acetyltransferase
VVVVVSHHIAECANVAASVPRHRPPHVQPSADMTPQVTIEQVTPRERDVLWRYLQFYIYDMSRFTGAQPVDGVFPYSHFDAYWGEGERRSAWWAKVGGEIAGFALVRLDAGEGRHEIAEFFIVNRWRRRGIGLSFARQLLTRFPGPWRLHELANNQGAIAFWRRVLGGFAPYTEAPRGHVDGIERIEQRFVVS